MYSKYVDFCENNMQFYKKVSKFKKEKKMYCMCTVCKYV